MEHGYKNLWMSPNVAINRLKIIIEKYGIGVAIKRNEFRHEREAWIAAVFLLGLRKFDKNEYWLEVETEQSTPDIYGYYIEKIEDKNHRWVCDIEITEREEHGGSIAELIENKSKKSYPRDFYLLIYARKSGELLDYDKIYEAVKRIKIPFSKIFILCCISDDNDYALVEVFPKKYKLEFNLDVAIEGNKDQLAFATFLKRGKGTKPVPLGEIFVPLPEIKKML